MKGKSKKPEKIVELENRLGIEIVQVEEKIVTNLDSKESVYVLDSDLVVGLKIHGISLSDVSFLEDFPNLKSLSLWNNSIRDISILSKLTSLTSLNLAINKIDDFSPLSRLSGLKILWLSYNKIEDNSFLSELTELTYLRVSGCELKDISSLSNSKKLDLLVLRNNNVTDITSLSKLVNLGFLDLSDNYIESISPLKNLDKLRTIDLSNNPVKGVPVSDLKDVKAIKGYFETLEEKNKDLLEANYHVKVNIVGSGNIGKTQLFNWFLGNAFEEKRTVTHGTNVKTYMVKNGEGKKSNYKASLWDFGGQSYQHGTHSLFLRPQDFYLVLFRNENDDHDYGYWLGAARSFSQKVSEGNYTSPLFLIQSVWSEKGDELIYPKSRKVETYQVSPDHCLSLDVKKCFDTSDDLWSLKKDFFQKILFDRIVEHAKSFGEIPKRFNEIRTQIERRKILYLKRQDFMTEYAENLSEERLAYLLQYLEFAGTIVYFREKELLNEYVFINPKRLSDWIYKTVLNEEFLKNNRGVLDFQKLKRELRKERANIFKSLMLNFNLLFEEPQGKEEEKNQNLVIPQFLPENDHSLKRVLLDLIPFTFSIRFEDFIYEGRIFNFISEYGEYAEDNSSYWKYGILFKKDEVKCVVYYDIGKRIIHVHIENRKEAVKLSKEILDYFILKAEVKETDDEIRNEQGKRIKGIRLARRNLEPENIIIGAQLSTNEENYIDIIETLKQKGESYQSGICKLTHKSIPLDVLTLKLLEMEDKRLKKVFISYSREDVQYKNELRSHLSILNRYDLIKEWTCEDINMGKWHKQIQKELEEADIIIYMVSHNFLDSDYIMEKEVKKGIELVENDPQKKILCVLVGSCQWNSLTALEEIHNPIEDEDEKYTRMSLDKYQFLPYHQYKSPDGVKVVKEELVPLEKWGRNHYEVINEAYNQIAGRILKEIR